jgi:hypothetical protein
MLKAGPDAVDRNHLEPAFTLDIIGCLLHGDWYVNSAYV